MAKLWRQIQEAHDCAYLAKLDLYMELVTKLKKTKGTVSSRLIG